MIERKIIEKWINEMNENTFREKALIPLFQKMGFQNITHYHGGSGELGKDIVMWKNNDFRKRENYAVIVKVGAINGKVNGKGSFTDIVIQVQQAFGSKFIDEAILEEQKIDRCIIVTNCQQKKEMTNALAATISDKVNSHVVTNFDYNTLIDYLIEYKIMPNSTDALIQALEIFDPKKIIKSISLKRDGSARQIGIEIDGSGDPENLSGAFSLSFPKDIEGEKAKLQYEDFLNKGTRVEIPKKYISSFVFPKVLEYFNPNVNIEKIVLGPVINPRKVFLDLLLFQNSTIIADYKNLEFSIQSIGKKAICLKHDNTQSPFELDLTINIEENMNISCRIKNDLSEFSVFEVFTYFRFLNSFDKGDTIKIHDSKTNLKLLSAKLNKNNILNPDNKWLSIFEKAAFIQKETNIILLIPKNGLKIEDIKDIEELYNIIKNGYNRGITGSFELSDIDAETADKIVKTESGKDFDICLSVSHTYSILGQDIDIGEVKYYIRRGIAKYSGQDEKVLTIDVSPDNPATAIYTKYLKDKSQSEEN